MMDISNLTTKSKFDKYHRSMYAVSSSNGSTTYYATKESAYEKMEAIKHQLEMVACLESFELNDLDCRVDSIKTDGGASYELLTLSIEW